MYDNNYYNNQPSYLSNQYGYNCGSIDSYGSIRNNYGYDTGYKLMSDGYLQNSYGVNVGYRDALSGNLYDNYGYNTGLNTRY